MIFSKEPQCATVFESKIVGRMQEWINNLIINKIVKKKGNIAKDGDDILLLNCFHGAESIKTEN